MKSELAASAIFDPETGEFTECKLVNGDGEAERFYEALEKPARVGLEACETVSGSSICCSG